MSQHFIVTQIHDTNADDPIAAAREADQSGNSIYRVEDDLGRLYEVDLIAAEVQAIPLPPF